MDPDPTLRTRKNPPVKPRIVGQLSWPVPIHSWLHCRAQFGWTEALTNLKDEADVVLVGNSDDGKRYQMSKDGCKILFAPEEEHGTLIPDLKPDVVFWNDFPPIIRNWITRCPEHTRHIMRMHGDYRRFFKAWDVMRKAWTLVVPMHSDIAVCTAMGVPQVVRIPFCVDMAEMTGGPGWEHRAVHVASPASTDFKGRVLWEALKKELERRGLNAQTAAWRDRANLRGLLHSTRVFFNPSAHEGLSRVTTEAAVAGCGIVVSAESHPMLEQAGLQGGFGISTGLLADPQRNEWIHRRPVSEIADDLQTLSSTKWATKQLGREWDIRFEVDLLTQLFRQALCASKTPIHS